MKIFLNAHSLTVPNRAQLRCAIFFVLLAPQAGLDQLSGVYSEPVEGSRIVHGRQLGSLLERIRNHHGEHGHLGKRYAEVIKIFNPSFEYGRTHAWQKEASHALLSQ